MNNEFIARLISILEATHNRRIELKAGLSEFESLYWVATDSPSFGRSDIEQAIHDFAEKIEYFDQKSVNEPGLFGETEMRKMVASVVSMGSNQAFNPTGHKKPWPAA